VTGSDSRLTDAELWAAVETTLGELILPELDDAWARAAAVQLIGLARYAQDREHDRSGSREAELVEVLDRLAADGNEIATATWPDPGVSPTVAASRCLVAAVVRDDEAALTIRDELRSVLARQLDDELEETGTLLEFFRGRLPDA